MSRFILERLLDIIREGAGKRTIGSICSKFVTITITVVDASGGGWKRGRNGDETRGVGSHETRGPVTSVHAFSTWKNFVHRTRDKRVSVFRYGGLREGKKRRYGGKYWYGENFKVNRARDCRSKINWWKANNTLEFGGVAWSAGWKEDGGCWARQRLVRRRD